MALYSNDKSGSEIDYRQEFSHLNILSVDVDWIMEPSINIYNGQVHNDVVDTQLNIALDNPGVTLTADLVKYYQLCKLLFSMDHLKPKDVFFGISHDQIVHTIIDDWQIKTPYSVWNVDHHHDCGYGDPENLFEHLGCGNWVPILMRDHKFFEHYRWINNKNSDVSMDDIFKKHIPDLIATTDIQILDNIKFDKVFLCKSPGWVPTKYHALIDSLYDSFAKFINK